MLAHGVSVINLNHDVENAVAGQFGDCLCQEPGPVLELLYLPRFRPCDASRRR